MIVLPHANKQQIPVPEFLGAWKLWFERFQPGLDPANGSMPILLNKESLIKRLGAGAHFSFDVLCRMIANRSYRNGMQALPKMVDGNSQLLERTRAVSPISGRDVDGVRLTALARERLHEACVGPALLTLVDALEEGDDDQQSEDVSPVAVEQNHRASSPVFPQDLVARLVSGIENDFFSPTYRGKPGKAVTGWRTRLSTYFWPRPEIGYTETCQALAPLLETAEYLATTVGQWNPEQQKQAETFADDVFLWGGVPQRRAFDWHDVEAVLISAAEGRARAGAPMNSGWTKIAAFTTAHLGPERGLVIWDSRVAYSLIRRLDTLLKDDEHTTVPAAFRNIGWVPGRGGNRKTQPKAFALKNWKSGYQRWESVYAGSALVRAIRDELNAREAANPQSDGRLQQPWTLRQVEMVLFMDGY
jgi:hypothetical protein